MVCRDAGSAGQRRGDQDGGRMNIPRPLSEPRKRALEVLVKHPDISERAAAKLAGVSRGTIRIVLVEYARQLPKSPVTVGSNGKATYRRRRFVTLANGKRKLLRTWVPHRIWTKLLSVANAIALLPDEKERQMSIKALRGLVREAIERNKQPRQSLDQLSALIFQQAAASRLASGR